MAHATIPDLVHAYSDAVVHRDGPRWAATWDEAGVWNPGNGVEIAGREAILDTWRRAMTGFETVVQTVLNGTHTIDADSGRGRGRQYVQEHYRRATGEPGILLGYYDDDYVRRDEGWLFARRSLVRLYHGPPDLSGGFPGVAPTDG